MTQLRTSIAAFFTGKRASAQRSLYQPLALDGEGHNEDSGESTPVKETFSFEDSYNGSERPTPARWTLVNILACLLCLTSTAIAIFASSTRPSSPYTVSPDPVHDPAVLSLAPDVVLKRPSQYSRVDAMYREKGQQWPFEPIDIFTFPTAIAHVDADLSGPVRAATTRWKGGLPARKVEVTDSVSTIIQFRTIDWGMEACTLHINHPALPLRAQHQQRTALLISRVDLPTPLTRALLASPSISVALPTQSPDAGQTLGRVDLSASANENGTAWTYDFPCAFDSLHTFVLSAEPGSENIEWWQDSQSETPAIFIVQHATA